jgi:anti-sigma regulatory factor (Ser/Thr protein kinase)
MAKKVLLFTKEYPSSLESRREMLDKLVSIVAESHIPIALTMSELTLIYDEAITNAMEHGNGWDAKKHVLVSLWRDDDAIRLVIEDEGNGFDFNNPKSEFIKGNRLSQRGRGISLIKKFCSPSWDKEGSRIELPVKII